ncbi:MAG: hypothetical protein E4H19_11525, partial [Chromatiales bacterium]
MFRISTVAIVLALMALLLTGCRNGPDATTTDSFLSLPSPAADGSTAPHLALTPAGDVVMSWLEPAADGSHALKFATLDGERWSPAKPLTIGSDW